MSPDNLEKAAQCGEPSYVWRTGQSRRLNMIIAAAGNQLKGRVLENGCGIGVYVQRLSPFAGQVIGLEYDFERCRVARQKSALITNAAGENLPYPNDTFQLILSHEVLEHVRDDQRAVQEMLRVLCPGGKIILFCPNRGYPFETHGIYWRGRYHFGNIPLVNYLPNRLRNRLAPHVRIYTRRDVEKLFQGQPVRYLEQTIIFGAYDNIIARFPRLGRVLRAILQGLEHSPLRFLGLSHFWVIEKVSS